MKCLKKETSHTYTIYRRGYGSIFDGSDTKFQCCDDCDKPEYEEWFNETEVISEERDKVWKLYGISESELEKEKNKVDDPKLHERWIKHLLSDGLKQRYRYCDDGGEFIGEEIFSLVRGDKPSRQ